MVELGGIGASHRALGWVRAALVLEIVGSAMLAVLACFGGATPTPTQAALAGWCLWLVPIAALVVERRIERGIVPLALTWLAGWSITAVWALVAVVLFPHYPRVGPHEALAMMFYVGPVLSTLALGAGVARRSALEQSFRPLLAGCFALALLGGGAAYGLFGSPLMSHVPLRAHPIEHARHFDVMGERSEFLSAPMNAADFRGFVRALGLSRSTTSRAVPGPFGRPAWFRPPADAELWLDREAAAQSSREGWCWTMATWDGRMAFASTGCGRL